MGYPLELSLRPSRRLQGLIAAIHLVAAIAFLASALPASAVSAALAALGLSLVHAVRRERAKGGGQLTLHDDGRLTVRLRGGMAEATALPGCTEFGWAIWLVWRQLDAGGRRGPARGTLILLPDSVTEVGWRPLRIWLRHKAPPPEAQRAA